jgi:hypothetical protein
MPAEMTDRRFPPPWTLDEHDECFIVRDANGQALGLRFESQNVVATMPFHIGAVSGQGRSRGGLSAGGDGVGLPTLQMRRDIH